MSELAFLLELPIEVGNMRGDVLAGLSLPQKSIPPKYFYDARGAELFVEITQTPEYYPTRTEVSLLQDVSADIAAWAGSAASVIEPGSGAAQKVRPLLTAMDAPYEYILFDISTVQLQAAGRRLKQVFPDLRVGAVSGDFTGQMPQSEQVFAGSEKRICFFPGSTIGNFDPVRQVALLQSFKSLLRPGDAIVLGADGVKDAARLDAAYNDSAGLTAAFNLNLLERLKNEFGAQLDRNAFQHLAFYCPEHQRIEMHLLAKHGAQIVLDGQTFSLAPGETIHTENSWKFDKQRLSALARAAGLRICEAWCARSHSFHLVLFEVV